MKFELTYLLHKIRQSHYSLSFKQAFVFSILCHLFLLTCFGFIAKIFNVNNHFEQPLVLDFVFTPSDDYQNMKFERSGQAEDNKKQSASEILVSENHNQPDIGTAGVEMIQKQVSAENLNLRSEKINYESIHDDDRQESTNFSDGIPEDDKYTLNTLEPAPLTTSETEAVSPDFLTAKISMGKKQHKMLQKKFKNWAENFHKLDLKDSTLVWEDKGKLYKATFQNIPAQNNTDMDEVHINIETVENGVILQSEMRMKRLAFSSFAQFVDYWDPNVAVHDDVLEGRFHANSKINIMEHHGIKPEFHGKVTTSSPDIKTSSWKPFFDEESVFLGGLETGVKPISLPRNFMPFLSDSTIAGDQIHQFDADTKITFHANGTYSWRIIDSGQPDQTRTIHHNFCYLVGTEKATLHLEGVVKGKILVYSEGDIIIDGDLTYASHPEASNFANDYLGLVSKGDIEIANPEVTGPGNLNIYAAIYARNRFRVRHLNGKGNATLFIYGSLTAGSLSATEPRYATRIRFDKRLERIRPPGYPMTNRYEVSDFETKWQVKHN